MTTKHCIFSSLACWLVVGCSDGSLAVPRTYPVSGTVTYKGKPIPGVRVLFHPQFDIGAHKFVPNGMTNRDGQFTLSTGNPSDGAPPGEYTVTFQLIKEVTDGQNELELDVWKGKYANPETTVHRATVVKGENKLGPYNLE